MVTASGLTLNGTQTYGIDLSGGTWSSAVFNLDANPKMYTNGTQFFYIDDTAGVYNFGIGNNVFAAITSGTYNFCLGRAAGDAITEGDFNFLAGAFAGSKITTADSCVAVGTNALFEKLTGNPCIGIGNNALYSITTNGNAIAIGSSAARYSTKGSLTAIGVEAMQNHDSYYTVAIGQQSAQYGTGNYGTYIGYRAGRSSDTVAPYSDADDVTAIGALAALDLTSGDRGTFIGKSSGENVTSGNAQVFVGWKSGFNQTTADNLLIIDNQDRGSAANEAVQSLIYGTFNAAVASQILAINAGTFTLNAGTDTDMTVNFTGTTNSGVLKWMEDEDEFEFDDDIVFSGDSVGLPFGDMYTNTTIAVTISIASTPTEVKDATSDGFTAGELHKVTFPTGGDEHYLAVDKAGRYLINWSISCAQNSPAAAIELEGGVMIGGSAQNPGRAHRTVANSTDKGNMGGTCILDLAANAQVSLYVSNETNTTNIDVDHANLTVMHVGGT
jgi:hypothetical protein